MDVKLQSVRYHELFDCDVREAAGWYDKRVPGLGESFKSLVQNRVEEVIAYPLRFPQSEAGCRYARIARFPYVLLYDVVEKDILMLAVLHTARSMDKWRERLQDR